MSSAAFATNYRDGVCGIYKYEARAVWGRNTAIHVLMTFLSVCRLHSIGAWLWLTIRAGAAPAVKL